MGQGTGALRASSRTSGKQTGSGRDDVKRQVDNQAGEKERPIYELVNMKNGGGKLIDLIKSSSVRLSHGSSFNLSANSDDSMQRARHQDEQLSKRVDRDIEALVLPLLYNEGRGKLIPLKRIWQLRFGAPATSAHDSAIGINDNDDGEGIKESACRWVCWRLDERGFVGETALHICFLLSTPSHMILAKRLLTLFPMLINDIYTCDEYFGESCLHMAIVNEDVRMVKLLLDHGAEVHERCLGSFWLPDDQKGKANVNLRKQLAVNEPASLTARTISESTPQGTDNLDLHQNQFSDLMTDYNGYLYWGEYALSFAACLGLYDCYKLLLAKGANPNRQDSNGNSTLHMAVIANRRDMFDLCYSNGANLNLLNRQKLSPLQLAAKLRRVELFFHILSIHRQVNWIFCNVGFVELPLAGLDSISELDGSCDPNSVLSIVVSEVNSQSSNEHLQMLDGPLSQLLQTKWDCVVRQKFYSWLYQFLLFMLVALMAYMKRFIRTEPSERMLAHLFRQEVANNGTTTQDISQIIPIYSHLALLELILTSEYVLITFVLYYLWFTFWRSTLRNSRSSFRESLLQAPEVSVFSFNCLLILACIPIRLLGWSYAEDIMASLIMLMLPLKLLFFCRASLSVGSFVFMIYKILVNDVLSFSIFSVILIAGFSQSFLIMFKSYDKQGVAAIAPQAEEQHFVNLFDGFISMHMMALNEFGIVFDQFQGTNYRRLSKFIFCIYMVLAVIEVNMLIASLGKTYQDIASQPNESLRQWARALLIIERMWTNEHRLSVLHRYSRSLNRVSASGRFYGSTWPLKKQDRLQIEQLSRLRDENRKNAARLARLESAYNGQ